MRRIGVVVASTVVISVAAAGQVSAITIRGSGSSWRPSTVDIDRGDRVRVAGGERHAHGAGVRWGLALLEAHQPGESVSRTFRQRGTYRFYCSIHGSVSGGRCTGMCGKVRV